MPRLHDPAAIFELKETSNWLRYVFWIGALAMLYLGAERVTATVVDWGKAIGLAACALLLGFSGFVLEERRIAFDPTTRTVSIRRRGFRRRSVETIGFSEIRRLAIVAVPTTWEDSNGRSRPDTGFSAVLVLDGRNVPINAEPLSGREQAQKLAEEVAARTGSPIAASDGDAIDFLLASGRTVDAVAALARAKNLSLTDAKAEIDRRIAALPARTRDA